MLVLSALGEFSPPHCSFFQRLIVSQAGLTFEFHPAAIHFLLNFCLVRDRD